MNILKEITKNYYKYFSIDVFKKLEEKIGKENILINSLTSKSVSNLLFSLCAKSEEVKVLVVEDTLKAEEFLRLLKVYDLNCEIFTPKEFRNFDVESESREQYVQRMRIIRDIERQKLDVVIIPVKALFQKMIPVEKILKEKVFLAEYGYTGKKLDEDTDLDSLIKKLIYLGYKREASVEAEGTFSLKGGILDIGLNKEKGVRLEFWGDEIESIRKFNIDTKRSYEKVEYIQIYPAYENIVSSKEKENAKEKIKTLIKEETNTYIRKELENDLEKINSDNYFNIIEKYLNVFYEDLENILDFLVKENLNIFFYEIQNLFLRISNIDKERLFNEEYIVSNKKHIPFYYSSKYNNYEKDFKKIYEYKFTYFNLLKLKNKFLPENIINIDIKLNEEDYGKNLKDFLDNIERKYKSFKQAIIFSKKTEEIKKYLKNKDISSEIIKIDEEIKKAKYKNRSEYNENIKNLALSYLQNTKNLNAEINANNILIYPENLDCGIENIDSKILFAGFESSKEKVKRTYLNKTFRDAQKIFIGDLMPGDFVVHKIYGIGKFEQITKIEVLGVTKEYLKLEYAGKSYLYIPIANADNVRKFIGANTESLKLNSLDGKAWEKTKTKLKKSLREVAGELIKLYSERENNKGFAFSKDTKWQKDFEDEFKYVETNDQLKCIEEIKKDMEKDKPMDRLLCGDVGFGKTEVAQRAAFKAVMDGKQVAYLAPTTILVKQQYDGFKERFKNFPVEIDYVSRMKTNKQNEETLEKLKSGQVDILIGTHRLLSSDVSFKDLGLLIIDEEHRFGVKAKEKIKFLKKQIDVLSMSATPIPRTLSMSLSGIRDMSVIYEPPKNRKPVKTYLLEYSKPIIDEAIIAEIERGGQVFYIHNRIQTINKVYEDLSKRLKNVRFAVAHGRMAPKQIEDVMQEFLDRKIDVLISTSIIETGIDIENANTLIIENADRMGLAQLYQIRGRVGRGEKKAYAYLTFKKDKLLSENAEKRLNAIKDFTELGSGYKIALRDLEIRGAGSVLGEMQSGHIEQVGYDMYVRILNEVISEARNIEVEEDLDIKIELNIDSYIPDEYIEDKKNKIEVYQKIADIKTIEQENELKEELRDRFGKIPNEVYKLIKISKIKEMLKQKKMDQIKQVGNNIRIYYTDKFNPENIIKLAKSYTYSDKFLINQKDWYIEYKLDENFDSNDDKTQDKLLEDIINFLKRI